MPGPLTRFLDEAVADGGNRRALFAPGTTLSRRGLRIRARKRADELARWGVGPGDLVVVGLGNAAETVVTLLACDRLGAACVLADPTLGNRPLDEVCAALAVRAVLRRPAGQDTPAPAYPGHEVRSRKRGTSGLALWERLEPVEARPGLPAGAALLLPAVSPSGAPAFVVRSADEVARTAVGAAKLLDLDEASVLVPTPSPAHPVCLEAVVLAALAARAALLLDDAPGPATLRTATEAGVPLVATTADVSPRLETWARAGGIPGGARLALLDTDPRAAEAAEVWSASGGAEPRTVVYLEETGPLAARPAGAPTAPFEAPRGVSFHAGAAVDGDGVEWLAGGIPAPPILPAAEEDGPGTPAGIGDFLHTGFLARMDGDRPLEVLGRADGLVWIHGQRGSLEAVEACALELEGVRAAEADLAWDEAGTRGIVLRIEGPAAPEAVRAHLVGRLSPAFVPTEVIGGDR